MLTQLGSPSGNWGSPDMLYSKILMEFQLGAPLSLHSHHRPLYIILLVSSLASVVKPPQLELFNNTSWASPVVCQKV